MPESSHEMEMVGRVTVSPAAGDINWTSAKAQGTSVANSQANRRIIVVVSAGSEGGQPVMQDQCRYSQEGRKLLMCGIVCLDNSRWARKTRRRRSSSSKAESWWKICLRQTRT